MLFWTFLFIMLYAYCLICGNFVTKAFRRLGLIILEIKSNESNLNPPGRNFELSKKMLSAAIAVILPATLILIAEIIYFTAAIPLDPLKYPSMIMLGYLAFNFLWSRKKASKCDFETEESRIRCKVEIEKLNPYGVRTIVLSLVKMSYFIYMFWILAF